MVDLLNRDDFGIGDIVPCAKVDDLLPGGVVETEGTHSGGIIGSEFEKAAIAQTPLGRIGQPGDIASIAVFLASEDSAWLTGERATSGYRWPSLIRDYG